MPGVLSGYLHKKRNALVRSHVRGNVLDIGCGPASIAEFLDPCQKYVGIEVQEGYITYLRSRFPQHTFLRRDVDREPLALGNLRFDTVLMIAVVEHLASPERVIEDARNYMKPDSQLLITTPTALGSSAHRLGARLGLFAPEAVADHKCVYSRPSLSDLLERCGMQIVAHTHFELGANQLCISTPRV